MQGVSYSHALQQPPRGQVPAGDGGIQGRAEHLHTSGAWGIRYRRQLAELVSLLYLRPTGRQGLEVTKTWCWLCCWGSRALTCRLFKGC